MGGDDLVELEVEDDVRAHHDHIGLLGAGEELLVGDDVAQQEATAALGPAEGGAGNREEAALLAVEHPLLAVAHMVDDGAVVTGHHEADGLDAGVRHVGEREVDQAVTPDERDGRDGARVEQHARGLARVVGSDVADGLMVDHRIIPPSRSPRRFQRRRCPSLYRRIRALRPLRPRRSRPGWRGSHGRRTSRRHRAEARSPRPRRAPR